jgi:tetratricopeptide (TPR) repeat protein
MSEAAQQAQAHFQAGEYRQSREAALAALTSSPEDVELLLLAGRAGVEIDSEDATEQLRRATELAPDNAETWHYLGEALATEGNMEQAGEAFRRAVELNPEDQVALSHLGHTSAATGRQEEAMDLLNQAAQSMRGASTAAISLVDMYRQLGQYEEGLVQARRIAEAEPEDVVAALDVAELSLLAGHLDEALAAFARVRELDDTPAQEAAPEMLALLEAKIGTPAPETAADEGEPTAEGLETALSATLAQYRRMHADDRRLGSEDILG